MNIVLTGSLGNVGKPLTEALVRQGHAVTVISSNADRRATIESLGAQAAISQMQAVDFLANTFEGAGMVYLSLGHHAARPAHAFGPVAGEQVLLSTTRLAPREGSPTAPPRRFLGAGVARG